MSQIGHGEIADGLQIIHITAGQALSRQYHRVKDETVYVHEGKVQWEVGDPGVTHDVDTAAADLPDYEGPPDPPAGHTHEWGEDVAAEAGLAPPPDERS